ACVGGPPIHGRNMTTMTMKGSNTVKATRLLLATAMLAAAVTLSLVVTAAQSPDIPPTITTPDKVETRLGTLEFKDGAPSKETVEKFYDHLDFMHATEAFVNAFQGASTFAIWRGLKQAGVADNTVLVFSELMDAKSLFLTANADTVYFWTVFDVT